MARYELLGDQQAGSQQVGSGSKRFEIVNDMPSGQNDESLLGTGLRTVARAPFTLAKVAAIPGDLGQLWLNYMHGDKPGEPDQINLPQSKDIDEASSKVATAVGLPKDYFKSQGKFDDFMDLMTVDLPAVVATGGSSLWKRALVSAASSGAIMGARESGAGALGQIAAGMTGRVAGNFFARGGGLKNIKKAADIKRKDVYGIAEKEAKRIVEHAPDVQERLGVLIDEARKANHFEKQAETIRDLTKTANLFNRGKVNLNELWLKKKDFNKTLGELKMSPQNVRRIEFIKRAQSELIPFMDTMATKYPKFGIPYKIGEDLTVGLAWSNPLKQMIKGDSVVSELIKKNPIISAMLGTGVGLHGVSLSSLPTMAKTAAIAYPASRIAKYAAMYYKSPEIRKLVHEVMKSATMGDKQGVIMQLTRLNQLIPNDQR
jgi:hypothetical protein